MRWLLVLLIGLSGAVGLGCGPRDRGLDLKDSVRTYNQHLRWNRFEAASGFIAIEQRAQWLASRTSSAAGLHITNIQVVRLQKPDLEQKTVEVLVSLSWYRMPETRVQQAVYAQVWQEFEGRWRIIDEHEVKNAETPPPQWP